MSFLTKVIKGSCWGALGYLGLPALMGAAPLTLMPPVQRLQSSLTQAPGTGTQMIPPTPGTEMPMVPPDNSKKNVRDKNKANPTPMAQGSSAQDTKITKDIRQEINKKDEISINGKNIKIITKNSMVTLRGPVATEEEKQIIYEIASRIAGPTKVKNDLEVK